MFHSDHSASPQRVASLQPAMNVGAAVRLTLRTLILAVFGLVLTWLVLSRSVGAFLADAMPQAALWLDPRQPEALSNLADHALSTASAAQLAAGLGNQA